MTEQITIRVLSESKMRLLLELLREFEFVEVVQVQHTPETKMEEGDFFQLAGLWKERSVSVGDLREKAWPRQR